LNESLTTDCTNNNLAIKYLQEENQYLREQIELFKKRYGELELKRNQNKKDSENRQLKINELQEQL
jgi:hypothetical protein